MLWLDAACMAPKDFGVLELLPLLTMGCQRFVMLAGPSYSGRLWAVVELFCFLKGGGELDGDGVLRAPIDRVTVLPFLDGGGRLDGVGRLEVFDIRQAQCSVTRDSACLGRKELEPAPQAPHAPREPCPTMRK